MSECGNQPKPGLNCPAAAVEFMSRRKALGTLAVAGAAAAMPGLAWGRAGDPASRLRNLTRYLETLARADGGYGWEGQVRSHLTPTFAVIGCYRALGMKPPRAASLAQFVRAHPPSRLRKLEQPHRGFEYQQIQSLAWLGEDVSSFRDVVRGWKQPIAYLKQYEQQGYPVFSHEIVVFACRALLGLPMDELAPGYVAYVESRRRANGSFNSTPAADGGDGHVMNTWWGLQALHALGRAEEKKKETIGWLRACQLPNGGFTWQPRAPFAGWDDVAYTWAAVRALHLLGSGPVRREACVDYLLSLENSDGGFGDRPGWDSSPLATRYALEALEALEAFPPAETPAGSKRRIGRCSAGLPPDLKVFSMQIEAHGKGSPAEAVDLARALRIHFWGAKNAAPEWLARAQAIADADGASVKFFAANEEYGTWVQVPGFGTYSHMSDWVAPAGADVGPSPAGQGIMSWSEFRRRRLLPLQRAAGRLVWQFGENEELVRLLLDDSLERGGYAAISTFHFGNPDFTNSEPFLLRYRGRIPFIALQDAHGDEPWWFADMTTGFRTVFLASEASWEGWLNALKRNWVVAIRHDAVTGFETWMHGGCAEVVDFVRQHPADWQWWDNPQIQRPLVSVVAVQPEDVFEAARPQQGVTLRVRCAWENTTQGRPRKPLAELLELVVDGLVVSPREVAIRAGADRVLVDHYHEFHLPNPAGGNHEATATVREIQSNMTTRRTLRFRV